MTVPKQHIETIKRARKALVQIQEEISVSEYHDGRLYEACDAADRDLLTVLVIVLTYGLADVTQEDLTRR